MIHYYSWDTSNSRKAAILLEELGLQYRYVPVDLYRGEHRSAWFSKLNINRKIPVLVDDNGPEGRPMQISESGAILLYLAERYECALLPKDPFERALVFQWLMFQMSSVGPMFGQALHFYKDVEEIHPYSLTRYMNEVHRLVEVMESHLRGRRYFASYYSIADIAIYPWVARHDWFNVNLEKYPNLHQWYVELGERPQVAKGMEALKVTTKPPTLHNSPQGIVP